VDAAEQAAVTDRLKELNYSCYDELQGRRSVIEREVDSDLVGFVGESHFLRDGLWLATHYVNGGPEGYTHDMVNNLWPNV
jgi:hypothetical protein